MIKIHSTKKLLAKLPLNAQGHLPDDDADHIDETSPLSGWHATLFTLQRRNCILFVHDQTRFPVFIKALLKPDFANLTWHFEDALMNTLLKLGASNTQMETAAKALHPLQIDTACDRSVQGTMTQMAGEIEHIIWNADVALDDVSANGVGVRMADRPTKIKGTKDHIWPEKEMFTLLDSMTSSEASHEPKSDNVVLLDSFRNK